MKEQLEVVGTILLDGRVVTPAKSGQDPVIVEVSDARLSARWKETGACRPVAPPAPPAGEGAGEGDETDPARPETVTDQTKNPTPPAPPAAPTPRKGGRL